MQLGSPYQQIDSPFTRAAARTVLQTHDGKYVVNGTLVANPDWTPEVGEPVTTLDPNYRPAGVAQYMPPAQAQAPNPFHAHGIASPLSSPTPFGSHPNMPADQSITGILARLLGPHDP